jgi:hypothetical protein
VRGDRKLSDDARTAISRLFDTRDFANGRALLLDAISESELRKCEELIGLRKPIPEFRQGIADAIFLSGCLHRAAPKRASTVRSEFKAIERQATAAAKSLEQLSTALAQTILCGLLPDSLSSLMAPLAIDSLYALATATGQAADRLNDRGGRARMTAFDTFIRLLADAFARATGHPAGLTWSEHRNRYEGLFWDLIDRLLPKAEIIAGGGFAPVGDIARGRQAQRILTAMDKTPSKIP